MSRLIRCVGWLVLLYCISGVTFATNLTLTNEPTSTTTTTSTTNTMLSPTPNLFSATNVIYLNPMSLQAIGVSTAEYVNGMNWTWILDLRQEPSVPIQILFTRFSTEWYYDFVKVYDTPDGSPILSASGTAIPDPETISSNYLRVQFTTDTVVTGYGWEATISVNATSLNTTTYIPTDVYRYLDTTAVDPMDLSTNVSITPMEYANKQSIYWIFDLRNRSDVEYVVLWFSYLSTQGNTDWVRIYDLPDGIALANVSGQVLPEPLTITTSYLKVHWSTDAFDTRFGFLLNIWVNQIDGLQPVPSQATLNLNNTAEDPSTIVGVLGPRYRNNMNVSWILDLRNRNDISQILVEFISFQTETNYDFVSIYDLPGDREILRASGSFMPSSLWISTNFVRIRFMSDSVITSAGWRLRLTALKANSTVSTPTIPNTIKYYYNSEIYLPNTDADPSAVITVSDSDYVNNMLVTWILDLRNRTDINSVLVWFSQFSIEVNFDYVMVFDLPDRALLYYSGYSIPPLLNITTQYVKVRFTTDGSVVRTGFTVNIWVNRNETIPDFVPRLLATPTLLTPSPTASPTPQRQITYLHLDETNTTVIISVLGQEYVNNMRRSWILDMTSFPTLEYIDVAFLSMMIDNGYDFIYIYDSPSGNLVSSYTGQMQASEMRYPVRTTSKYLEIYFYTDQIITMAGWELQVEVKFLPMQVPLPTPTDSGSGDGTDSNLSGTSFGRLLLGNLPLSVGVMAGIVFVLVGGVFAITFYIRRRQNPREAQLPNPVEHVHNLTVASPPGILNPSALDFELPVYSTQIRVGVHHIAAPNLPNITMATGQGDISDEPPTYVTSMGQSSGIPEASAPPLNE